MRTVTLALALLFALTGCGSSGSSSGGSSSFSSASEVAAKTHCLHYKHIAGSDAEMFTSDSGTCDYDGETVTFDWFHSADALKNFRKMADQFGGTALYGANFAVECDERATCEEIRGEVGSGKIG